MLCGFLLAPRSIAHATFDTKGREPEFFMQDPGQAPAGDAETAFAAGNIGVAYGDDL